MTNAANRQELSARLNKIRSGATTKRERAAMLLHRVGQSVEWRCPCCGTVYATTTECWRCNRGGICGPVPRV